MNNPTIDGVSLLPCPFCGETPVVTKHFKHEMFSFMHRCPVLGPISREFRESAQDHADIWNTRASPVVERQEPVAWMWRANHYDGKLGAWSVHLFKPNATRFGGNEYKPLYTAPPQLAELQAEIERLKEVINGK